MLLRFSIGSLVVTFGKSPAADPPAPSRDNQLLDHLAKHYDTLAREKQSTIQRANALFVVLLSVSITSAPLLAGTMGPNSVGYVWVLPIAQLLVAIFYASQWFWALRLASFLAAMEMRIEREIGRPFVGWERKWAEANPRDELAAVLMTHFFYVFVFVVIAAELYWIWGRAQQDSHWVEKHPQLPHVYFASLLSVLVCLLALAVILPSRMSAWTIRDFERIT